MEVAAKGIEWGFYELSLLEWGVLGGKVARIVVDFG